jgi:hypothetical protein
MTENGSDALPFEPPEQEIFVSTTRMVTCRGI